MKENRIVGREANLLIFVSSLEQSLAMVNFPGIYQDTLKVFSIEELRYYAVWRYIESVIVASVQNCFRPIQPRSLSRVVVVVVVVFFLRF